MMHDINEQNPSCQVSFNRHRHVDIDARACQDVLQFHARPSIVYLHLVSPRKGNDSSNHVKSERNEPSPGLFDVIDGLIIS